MLGSRSIIEFTLLRFYSNPYWMQLRIPRISWENPWNSLDIPGKYLEFLWISKLHLAKGSFLFTFCLHLCLLSCWGLLNSSCGFIDFSVFYIISFLWYPILCHLKTSGILSSFLISVSIPFSLSSHKQQDFIAALAPYYLEAQHQYSVWQCGVRQGTSTCSQCLSVPCLTSPAAVAAVRCAVLRYMRSVQCTHTAHSSVLNTVITAERSWRLLLLFPITK